MIPPIIPLASDTPRLHACFALPSGTCGALLWDILLIHSCGPLFRKLLWETLTGHSCGTLLWVTLVGNSCGTLLRLLWDTLVGLFCHSTNCPLLSPAPKVKRQVSKTSVSYETSSKSPKRALRTRRPQSLQNEHFVRDFLQK